ncbi:MAG: FAD-dependent oxidoreductase, partial [Desulfurococcaceae archaeon]
MINITTASTTSPIKADIIINAAGIYADQIAKLVDVEPEFKISPKKGEYILFDEEVKVKPKRILHTTPTLKTKGVYAVTTIHGNLMIGPTYEDKPHPTSDEAPTT